MRVLTNDYAEWAKPTMCANGLHFLFAAAGLSLPDLSTQQSLFQGANLAHIYKM